MVRNIDVALHFLSLDEEHKLFTKNLCSRDGRTFYEGNARLNKYMHLAQNIYITKHGEPLMDSVFYVYDNGAVDPKAQERHLILFACFPRKTLLGGQEKEFLDLIYKAFYSATLDELIDLSCEDPEWIDKRQYYNQKMYSMSRCKEYAEQYADIIKVMGKMEL